MIVDDRITTYLHSLEMPDIPVIEEIEKEALEAYVPIIQRDTEFPESIIDDTETEKNSGSRNRSRFFGCLNEPLYAKGRTYYHD